MRNMNCRNVRREIEEAAPGKWLSSDVNKHVLSCVACETLLREQTKLRELMSSLGTVEAPGDFDFRLRARLAGEKRAVAQSFALGNFSFGLRSAVVVTILLFIGSALMFVSFRTRSNTLLTAGVAKPGTDQKSKETVATPAPEAVGGSQVDKVGVLNASVNVSQAPAHPSKKRQGLTRAEVASLAGSNSQKSRDSSLTPAAVIKRDHLWRKARLH